MSFSTQPNEMVDMILNQTGIPLPQRIRLRAVSHRFRDILEDGLQQENSLVICVVNPSDMEELTNDTSMVQPNDLIISVCHFTEKKAIALIGRLFPHLPELAINSNSIIAWRKVASLLGHFARTLTSLQVDGHLKYIQSRNPVFRRLGEAINSIVSLSSLCLEKNGTIFDAIDEPSFGHHLLPHLATTLSRLERFIFGKRVLQNDATFIAASLGFRCTHLVLKMDMLGATLPFDDASTNLTHLHLEYFNEGIQILSQLPRLTTLFLFDLAMPDLNAVLPKFRPISQVTQVTFKGINYVPLEPPASKALTFPTIKQLTLQLYIHLDPFNAMAYLSTLASWFPSLSTCALHVPEEYREEIRAIQEGLPYTIKLIDNLPATF